MLVLVADETVRVICVCEARMESKSCIVYAVVIAKMFLWSFMFLDEFDGWTNHVRPGGARRQSVKWRRRVRELAIVESAFVQSTRSTTETDYSTMSRGDMRKVQVGTKVDIKRTDGRIHGALVSEVNASLRSLSVEWFEKGQTKGKDINFEQLLALNPQLLVVDRGASSTTIATGNANTTAIRADMRTVLERQRANVTPRPAQLRAPSIQPKSHATIPVPKAPAASARRQTISKWTLVAAGGSSGGAATSSPMNSTSNGHHQTHHHGGQQNQLPQLADLDEDDDFGSGGRGGAAAKRKSSTMQEIEKLQKNRDERRARQEGLRQQKAELMNVDPGNPNWEFIGMIREYRDRMEYHPLRFNDQIDDHQICVCVRKRPLNKKELARREIDVVTIPNRNHTIVHQPQAKVDLTKYVEHQPFRIDYAFDETSTNEMVYKFTAQPLVKTIFEQGFATCFAYGQTGSGKTHTMGGDFQGKSQEVAKGIYAMTTRDVFRYYNKHFRAGPTEAQLIVSCSFFEIYSGKVFDLLNNKMKLRVLEDGKAQVQVVGLQEITVDNELDVLELIKRGSEVRTAGTTSANDQSSRSHAVFQIILRKKTTKKLHGKFSLVDLAGNERGADTFSSNRQTRMEGAEINKSLLALKECIRALGRRNAHLPFRASKLTLVLRDSFIGDNARTCMIAMISPGLNSCEHTLNTLRYANRVKELGTDPDAAMKGSGSKSAGPPNGLEFLDDLRSEETDLALLHSHNEEEQSNGLFEFQMVVDKMQEQEERVVDDHTKLIEEMETWLKQHRRLAKVAEAVDFDTEQYARELRGLLDSSIGKSTKVLEQVDILLGALQLEETAALKTTAPRSTKATASK